MSVEEAARRELVALCHDLGARGWVANHDGNVSCRLGDGRYLASPTAVHKGRVTPEMLVVLDGEGKVVQGTRKGFSEFVLHLAVYRARPDAAWVVHAHPPHATAWAVAGEPFFDPPFMPEPVVSLGRTIPLVPYIGPGASTGALEAAVSACDAVLLESHGALTCAKDAETAFLRMELVEHLARIALLAKPLGGARPIPESDVEKLLQARAKAGLGPQAALDAAPGAPAWGAADRPDVGSLVKDALKRLG